jgi:HEAT repeat protein
LNAALQLPLLQEREREEAAGIFRELSDPAVLGQFFHALAEGALDPTSSDLGVFLAHLGPGALPLLVQAVEDAESAAMKDRLTGAIQTLAMKHPSEMKALLSAPTPAVAAGAARLAGRLGRPELAGPVAGLLAHDAAHVRLAATEALIRIASSVAMEGLKRALADDDRDVRVAAARGLASLRYAPARGWFEALIQGREIRDADLTEKMAFFEAYGVIAKGSGIELLDRLLNGRRLFSRQPPEMRACAALALGRVGTPAARDALRRAGEEQNPIVRNAVTRALRDAQSE